jgi:hypothetical protein
MKWRFAVILLAGWTTLVSAYAQDQDPQAQAAFGMPMNVDNWRADVIGQNGVYRFRQVKGSCQITFVQNLGVEAAKAAGQTVSDSIAAYVRRLGKQVGAVSNNEAPDLELHANRGDAVTFLSEEISYRGRDGRDYRNRIAAQWVGRVELLIVAGCPSNEWKNQEDSINAFLTKVSVNQFQ